MNAPPAQIRAAVDRILASPEWLHAARIARFLQFVVEQVQAGKADDLTESVIGIQVFGRQPDYDPKADDVVRVEARRVRAKLQEYYEGSGAADPIRIDLPRGTFVPMFEGRSASSFRTPWNKMGLVAMFVIVASAGVYWAKNTSSSSGSPSARLFTKQQGNSRSPALSPDGQRIAFSVDFDNFHSTIQIQDIDGSSPRSLSFGEVRDYEPSWSPDGANLAFIRERQRGRFAVMVKSTVNLMAQEKQVGEIAARGSLDWSADGTSILMSDRENPSAPFSIFRLSLAGGSKQRVTCPNPGIHGDGDPRVSPDGKWLAFVRTIETGNEDVYVMPTTGGEPRRITSGQNRVSGLTWTQNSNSIVASLERGGSVRSLWQLPLDGATPRQIPDTGPAPISPSVARNGSNLAFVARLADTNLWGIDPRQGGEARALTSSLQLDTSPQLSPDRKHMLWRSSASGSSEVWVANPDGSGATRLTRSRGQIAGSPHWSPDGREIVFETRINGQSKLLRIPVSGGNPKAVTADPENAVQPSYSRDGKSLYYSTDRNGSWELIRLDLASNQNQTFASQGAFAGVESPDGKFVYFTRQGQEVGGIWRKPVAGGPEELLVGELPSRFWGQWAVSSRAIFYAVYPGAGTQAIRRLDLATRKITDVTSLSRTPAQWDGGMTVADDESWLVWSQLDRSGSDIYIVDGFR